MNEQGGTVSTADCRSEENGRNIITEFPGKFPATVHCRIAFACTNDVIEKLLDQISRTLQKAGASDVSAAVSISPEAFRPTVAARTNAGWMAPSKGGDE
jgi:hypothetical protein